MSGISPQMKNCFQKLLEGSRLQPNAYFCRKPFQRFSLIHVDSPLIQKMMESQLLLLAGSKGWADSRYRPALLNINMHVTIERPIIFTPLFKYLPSWLHEFIVKVRHACQ